MSLYNDLLNAGLPVVSATDGGQATFSRSLTDDEVEIYHDLRDPQRPILRAELTATRVQIKAEYIATIDTLTQIENATSPTNAQVIAAVKFMAKTIRLILNLLARLL
jgi:hypothetical protein